MTTLRANRTSKDIFNTLSRLIGRRPNIEMALPGIPNTRAGIELGLSAKIKQLHEMSTTMMHNSPQADMIRRDIGTLRDKIGRFRT